MRAHLLLIRAADTRRSGTDVGRRRYDLSTRRSHGFGRAATRQMAAAAAAAIALAISLGVVLVPSARGLATPSGIAKIRHVVMIMQENRSFDSYFGTFPSADGIPMRDGVPAVCLPDPQTGRCVRPFHDLSDLNQGSAHDAVAARYDIAGGKMNGFVAEARRVPSHCGGQAVNPFCAAGTRPLDVMGYHTG